jgi:hypothetical protein
MMQRERLRKAHPTQISIHLVSFADINIQQNHFQAKVTVTQSWLASRRDMVSLASDHGHPLEWMPPRPNFATALEHTLTKSGVCVEPGTLLGEETDCLNDKKLIATISYTVEGKFKMWLDLKDFPFDNHALEIPISFDKRGTASDAADASTVGEMVQRADTTFEIITSPAPGVRLNEPGCQIAGYVRVGGTPCLTDIAKDSLTLQVHVARQSFSLLVRVVAVLALMSLLTLSALWLDVKENQGDRLGWVGTMFLTAVAYQFVMANMLPELPYLTALDVYMLSVMAYITAVIVEVGLLAKWVQDADEDVAELQDVKDLNWWIFWWDFFMWLVVQLMYVMFIYFGHFRGYGWAQGRVFAMLPLFAFMLPTCGLFKSNSWS